MKKCQSCKKISNTHVINSRYKRKDGVIRISYMCRECTASRARRYRTTENGKATWRLIMNRQYIKHKVKVDARQSLNRNVRNGIIKKPKTCSICNLDKRLEAHHSDYSKPLDVVWLCRDCHNNV